MSEKKYLTIFVFVLVFSIPQFLLSESNYEYIHSPRTEIYFGYITYTEVQHDGNDPVVVREGEAYPRVAELNFPLLPGDTIRTTGSRRCEIQLDTGTIIRLDFNTELAIETILAKSLSSPKKITNFLLNKGEIYIMYKRYNYPEIFQVITPSASMKLNHRTVALIAMREDGGTDIQIKLGKAFVIYGSDEDSLAEEILKKSMSLTISRDHQALLGEYTEDADFELWNASINKNFEEIHEGMSVIPKPILRYPRAVVYFAQKYSTLFGEWIWDDMYGYVWRSHYNDYYPGGTWQPYYYGQWREVSGQLFWIPMESWGWVPYHLGLWVWNKKRGWLWIPGSAFAPAWVSFHTWEDYCGWRPWSFCDWYLYGAYNRYPYFYLFNPELPDSPLDPGWDDFLRRKGDGILIGRLTRDQIQETTSLYPLSRVFKATLKRVASALERGDEGILASIKKNIEQTVVVKNGDLNRARIQERAVVYRKLPVRLQKNIQPTKVLGNPHREAARIYRKGGAEIRLEKDVRINSAIKIKEEENPPSEPVRSIVINRKDTAGDKAKSLSSDSQKRQPRFVPVVAINDETQKPRVTKRSMAHIRDWNPDAGIARRVGVSLKYSSRTNEIKCPELNLTSRSVGRVRNMMTMTGTSSARSSGYYSPGVISSSRSSSSSSSGTVSSSSMSSGRGSSKESGGTSSGGGAKKKK